MKCLRWRVPQVEKQAINDENIPGVFRKTPVRPNRGRNSRTGQHPCATHLIPGSPQGALKWVAAALRALQGYSVLRILSNSCFSLLQKNSFLGGVLNFNLFTNLDVF